VRAPDQPDVGRCPQSGQHAGRLRVVKEHDVARPHHLYERRGVGGAAALVRGPLRLAQGPAVALRPVQPIVEPLCDAEELGVALDDHPATVEPRSADVADQRTEHLRDPASERRRVHIPDRVRAEELMPARERALKRRQSI
jgi:hypothetical protein